MDNTQRDATEPKTLAQMTAEVVACNEAHGWYENCATFPEAMALLHSEVSEALDAWRQWGLEDATDRFGCDDPQHGDSTWEHECYTDKPPKPEGVGSEFADIFIRLLDDCWLFGKIDLEAAASPGRFGINDSFPANMNTLHIMIARASLAAEFEWDEVTGRGVAEEFGSILIFLRQLCEHYGIDLLAEYERKAAYNRMRPYRHGNRKI